MPLANLTIVRVHRHTTNLFPFVREFMPKTNLGTNVVVVISAFFDVNDHVIAVFLHKARAIYIASV